MKKEIIFRELKRLDWTLYFLSITITLIALVYNGFISTNEQPFYLNDATVWYPHKEHDTVPFIFVILFGVASFFCVFVVEFLLSTNKQIGFWIALRFFLNFGAILALSTNFNEIIKNYVGELRPDFGSRCLNTNFPLEVYNNTVITSSTECISENNSAYQSTFLDARHSFLSGHSLASFSIATLVSLYVIWKLFDLKCEKKRMFFRPLCLIVSTLVTGFACFVASSRVVDYKHHPWDVIGGGAFGAFFSAVLFGYTLIDLYQTLIPLRDNSNSAIHSTNSNDDVDMTNFE